MMRIRVLKAMLIAAGALLLAAAAAAPQILPALPTTSVAGAEVLVPNDLPASPALLIIGFTRASRAQTSAWSRQITLDVSIQKALTLYQVAVIEDVPALFRQFVIRSIRTEVPEMQRGHFLLATEHAETWRTLVSYAQPDAAYLVLLDGTHRIRWRTTSTMTELSYRALALAVATLAEH